MSGIVVNRHCILCKGIALTLRRFRIAFRICGRCRKGYVPERDLPKACEVAAATTDNRALKESLLEAAEILRQIVKQ